MGLWELAERYLGTSILPNEWPEASAAAERKLARIISREGDANGKRQEPYYLAQLIAEAIRNNRICRFSTELIDLMNTLEAKEKPAAKATSNSKTSASIVAEVI